ncbi:hypothetical protein SAMN04487939_12237 [Lysobacter sp. yr284]|uniref:hypothetical protein n=1 Tax=Lysobacter sp. yr284 TaxID=1761791 RepID=UPI00089A94D5|nr:hypothetical protein [Lysobacter sp. yr284]SDZ20155.1 hypothetical protein SAMN04487939_12237 [Lysobacter sp. yr284]
MDDEIMMARTELRSLRDTVERILLSSAPVPEAGGLTLVVCHRLANVLADRTKTFRTRALPPSLVEQFVVGCREELAPIERAIDQAKGWSGTREVPSQINEDEMTLRWLLAGLQRYFDGLEPEFAALPAHQLDRAVREARLMLVWDVADAAYVPSLRKAICQLENAILAATGALRN